MTNLFETGVFHKSGNTFYQDKEVEYLIAQRKKTTLTKPKYFIIAKVDSEEYYISSLYPTAKENQFNADYSGKKYVLVISDNQVEVKNRSQL